MERCWNNYGTVEGIAGHEEHMRLQQIELQFESLWNRTVLKHFFNAHTCIIMQDEAIDMLKGVLHTCIPASAKQTPNASVFMHFGCCKLRVYYLLSLFIFPTEE